MSWRVGGVGDVSGFWPGRVWTRTRFKMTHPNDLMAVETGCPKIQGRLLKVSRRDGIVDIINS